MNLQGVLTPVLALDVGEILGVIFLVLSVLGWFVKAVKGQNGNAAAPQAKKPAPQMRRMEIEDFLEEISGGKLRTPPAGPVKQNKVNKPRQEQAAAAKKANKPEKASKPKPVAALAQQHLAKSKVGEGLRAHVSNFAKAERIPDEVQQDLKSRIADEVRADLGAGGLAAAVPPSKRPTAHPLIGLLRNPEGVRQAIALQEILQRPRAFRRD